jgi:hypothetical protein
MALTSNGSKLMTLPELVLTADPETLVIYEFDLAIRKYTGKPLLA